MRSLIVLCAGGRIIDNLPIFLNRHPDGKLLAEKAIEGIYADSYDEIIFTILKEANEKYGISEILTNELGKKYNVKLAMLDKPTNGPAESVYLTIKELGISGEVAVRDSLNGIKIKDKVSGNFVAGLDLTKYDEDIFNVRSKSFIVTNEQGQILDVIEKRFRSDIISVGLYSFKKASDFIIAYEKLNDKNYPIHKMYLSNVISYLIGYKQRVFHCADVYFHEDWGTIETWNRLQKKYATVFIDTDALLGKYYSDELVDELSEKLNILSGKKISVILITRTPRVNKKLVYNKLEQQQIKCIDFVCKVSYSTEHLMIVDDSGLRKALLEV